MSLNLNIPKIAITPEAEEDDDNNFLNFSEALTDIEELYDETVSEKRHSYRKRLKIKVSDTDGYNTTQEDIEASDDDDTVIIKQHNSPIAIDSFDMEKYSTEENTGIAEKNSFSYQYLNMQLSETIDVNYPTKEESNNISAVTDSEDYDTENHSEKNNSSSDNDFCLDDYESIQAIKVSDEMQTKKQTTKSATFYKAKKKPPTFSQIMKARTKSVDNKTRRKKKCRVTVSKSNKSKNDDGSESSETGVTQKKNRRSVISMNSLNYESELEEDAQLPFPVCKKTFEKTKNVLQMPMCETYNLTDVEYVECEVDISRRRISVDNSIVQQQLDEMASCYSLTKDKNEAKQPQFENKESVIVKINRSDVKLSKNKKIHANSLENNLFVTLTEESSVTDVENIESSSDNEEPEIKNDEKYFSDTEEENFQDNLITHTIDIPEIILPPSTRLFIVAEENKSIVPTVRIFPLDDNILEGSEVETRSTDEESLNSAEEREENENFRVLHSPQLPLFEGGLINVSENCIQPRHRMQIMDETGTDVEDLCEEFHKNMKRTEFEYTGKYLIPNTARSLRNNMNEQDLTDDISGSSIMSLLYSENEAFTDMENLESTDDEERKANPDECTDFDLQNMKTHVLSIPGHIESHDTIPDNGDEIAYSRVETTTPPELKKQLNESSDMQFSIENSSKIDHCDVEKVMYLKGGGFIEVILDTQDLQNNKEFQLDNVMEAWEYFNHPSDKNGDSMKIEWCATKTDLIDVTTIQNEGTNQEAQVSPTCQISSFPSVSYESSLLNPESSIPKNEYLQKIKSYAQIDAMLDKMLNEVDLINLSKVNYLTLEPSSDALIEIPIKKLKNEKTYMTTVDIFVSEEEDNLEEKLSGHNYMLSHCNDPIKTEECQTTASSFDLLCSSQKSDFSFGDSNKNSSYVYDIETDLDVDENFYEPIDLQSMNQAEDINNIWWEGAYRNLSVVLEEDEDNLSQTSTKPTDIYTDTYKPYDFGFDEQSIVYENQSEQDDLSEYKSDSSQIPSSISTDDSDNEFYCNDSKAKVKLLIESKVGEPHSIVVKSVEELITKPNKQNPLSVVHENPRKLTTKLANKLSNIWVRQKHNNYSTLPSLNKTKCKKWRRKPSFTLPRIFFRNSEVVDSSDQIFDDEASHRRHNIIAKPNEKFPLSFDHRANTLSVERLRVDLYANIPFYPTYSCVLPISSSSPRKTQYIPPSDVTISEAYCDWSSEIESIGKETSPQYLDKLEEKLLDKTVDTCVVEFFNNESIEVRDLKQTLDETNAFLKFESEAEPYDVWTDNLYKDLKAGLVSTSNITPGIKIIKKGIFKTLKSLISKSTENLDSECDRFSPKLGRIDGKSETVLKISSKLTENKKSVKSDYKSKNRKQVQSDDNIYAKSIKNAENNRKYIVEHTYRADEFSSGSDNGNCKIKTEISEQNATYQIQHNNKQIEEIHSTNKLTKKNKISEYVDEIRDPTASIDQINENEDENLLNIFNKSNKSKNKCESLGLMESESQFVSQESPKCLDMPKKTGFWSFLTKKSKKPTLDEDEINLCPEKSLKLCLDEIRITKSFLEQEKNNYDDVSHKFGLGNLENEANILNKNDLQNTSVEKSEIPKSFLSKLKQTEISPTHVNPTYIKFDEYDLSYEPLNIVAIEKPKRVTFEEGTYKDKHLFGETENKKLPEKLICRLKAINSDAHISNNEVFNEGNNQEYVDLLGDELDSCKGQTNQVNVEKRVEKQTTAKQLERFHPNKILSEQDMFMGINFIAATDNFVKTEKILYDKELKTPILSVNQSVMDDVELSHNEILEFAIVPRKSQSNSQLEQRNISRNDSFVNTEIRGRTEEILVEVTNDETRYLLSGENDTKSGGDPESVKSKRNHKTNELSNINRTPIKDKNRNQFLDEDFEIPSNQFLTTQLVQYHDENKIRIATDSFPNNNISKQDDKKSRSERFLSPSEEKKQFSAGSSLSRGTEKDNDVPIRKYSEAQTQLEEEIDKKNEIISKETEFQQNKGGRERKSLEEIKFEKKEKPRMLDEGEEKNFETKSNETKKQINQEDCYTNTQISDLIELTNQFLKNEKTISSRCINGSSAYQIKNDKIITLDSALYKEEAFNDMEHENSIDSQIRVFPKMLSNELQKCDIPEEMILPTKNLDEENSLSASKRRIRYQIIEQPQQIPTNDEIREIFKKNGTEYSPSSNNFPSTNDFLATEKKFYYGQSCSKRTPTQVELEYSIRNKLTTEISSDSKPKNYFHENIKSKERKYIQSTNDFLNIEKNFHDNENYQNRQYVTKYFSGEMDMRKQQQMSQNENTSSNHNNHNIIKSKENSNEGNGEKDNIVMEKTLRKSNFETEEAVALQKEGSHMLKNSFEEIIDLTCDFLSTEIAMYDYVEKIIVGQHEKIRESSREKDTKTIEIESLTYQKKKTPDRKSRRFLKIFGKKTESRLDKIKNKNKVHSFDVKSTETFLNMEKNLYDCVISNIPKTQKIKNCKPKHTRPKGIFRIFTRKSEEKDKVNEMSQANVIGDEIGKESEIEVAKALKKNINVHTNKPLTTTSDNSKKHRKEDLFTNYKEISEATDVFLKNEKKFYSSTEGNIFNDISTIEEKGDIFVLKSTEVNTDEKVPEQTAKRKHFFGIFRRNSGDSKISYNSKFHGTYSEEKLKDDEYCENEDVPEDFYMKLKPLRTSNAAQKVSGCNDFSEELIESTNEFLHREKQFYHDVRITEPINQTQCNVVNFEIPEEEIYELLYEKDELLKNTEAAHSIDEKERESTKFKTEGINLVNTGEIVYKEERRGETLKEKRDKKMISEYESNIIEATEELSPNLERSTQYTTGANQMIDSHNHALNRKEESTLNFSGEETVKSIRVLQRKVSLENIQSSNSSKNKEHDRKSPQDERNSIKMKLECNLISTDYPVEIVKSGGVFSVTTKSNRSKDSEELPIKIKQIREQDLSFINQQACKLFLEKEVELYLERSPPLESEQLENISSEISQDQGSLNLQHLQHYSGRGMEQSVISTSFGKKPNSDNEKSGKFEYSSHIFDTASFIRKEVENYQDSFQTKSIQLKKNIQETPNSTSASSRKDEKMKVVKEYNAFDFIEEEVKNFENSTLPFTDAIDSSIRVETEIVSINADLPKEIIKKKIMISEKLIERPEQRNSNSRTTDTILEKLTTINKFLKDKVEQKPLPQQYSEFASRHTADTDNMEFIENMVGYTTSNNSLISDRMSSPKKSNCHDNLGTIKVEFVQKIKDFELAKGDVIEDVSLLEKKIKMFPIDSQEKVTDLDEGLPNELLDMETKNVITNVESIPVVTDEVTEETMEIKQKYIGRKKSGVLDDDINKGGFERKMVVTKLIDKGFPVNEVPETMKVTENFVKELEIQYHPDESSLSRNKNMVIFSLEGTKKQVADDTVQTTSQTVFINLDLNPADDDFEMIKSVPSEMNENIIQSRSSQEREQNKYEADDFEEDTAEVETSLSETNIRPPVATDSSKRKPLFRIESDDDDSVHLTKFKEINNQKSNISKVRGDLSLKLEQTENDLISVDTFALDSKSDTQIIEDKLRDLGKALDELERLSEIKPDGRDKLKEKKLRRVERKFERMASETLEPTTDSEQEVKALSSTENDHYQQLVSHMSTDEVISFQNEYNNLWDEYTFSKSDEWDSKTPESQADVLELPQDSCKQLTEASQNSSTNIQTPQPKPRHQKSKDIIEEHIHSSDLHVKQISPVRDDLLDENDRPHGISYSDKKNFWENISKYPSQQQFETAVFKKRKSIGETTILPVPKPRGGLQFSYSLAVTDNEKSSLVAYTEDESIPRRKDGMTLKEFLEHDSQLAELLDEQQLNTEFHVSSLSFSDRKPNKPLSVIKIADDTKCPDDVMILNQTTMLVHSDLPNKYKSDENIEIRDKHIQAKVEKSENADSDTEGSRHNSSQEGDNAGYISDCEDVEHYISDSEIEDRVPQIRERQMSVFVPTSVSQRTRYERSASLPTEDLYEVSARNTKLRKLYYEDQIKKEMIKEQLTIDMEDDISPERKSFCSPSNILESNDEQEEEQRNVTRYSTDDEIHINTQEIRTVEETSMEHGNFIPPRESRDRVMNDPKSETSIDNESIQFGNQILRDNVDEISPLVERKKNMIREIETKTAKEFIEVHVDKSETEKSEKATENLKQHSDDLTRRLSSIPTRDDINVVNSITSEQPTITVTLSGIQKRMSEEDDPYAPKIDSKNTNSTVQHTEKSEICQIQEEIGDKGDQSRFNSSSTENPLIETHEPNFIETIISEPVFSSEDTKMHCSSVLYQSEENIDSTVWEVSVESETLKEEKLSTLPSIPTAIQRRSIDAKFECSSDKLVETIEDLASELQNEPDLISEVHKESCSDKNESESHSDMKKIILDSLHQQKVDPEEANIIANSLILEIESEILKVEGLNEECRSRSESLDSGNQHVNHYLKELADAKGLDQREVELVESILERRQKQISKLTRDDTQASSMEITDEDLRYSEGDMDYTHVLEQQIDQLKAEYSDKLKTEYDSLVENQNVMSTKVDRFSDEIVKEKHCSEDYRSTNKDCTTRQEEEEKVNEALMNESTYCHQKNVIIEEDENISEAITEDMNKTNLKPLAEVKAKTHSEEKQPISEKCNEIVTRIDMSFINSAITSELKKSVSEEIEDISEKPMYSLRSSDSAENEDECLEIIKKDTISLERIHLEKNSEAEEFTEKQKILDSIPVQEINESAVNTKEFQQYEQTQSNLFTSFSPEHELAREKISANDQLENDRVILDKMNRTSSSDSKSSAGSAKSSDLFSVSSSDQKIDSEPFQDVVFRQSITEKESNSPRSNKKSGIELESYSSSGESHYHSFEIEGKSRPCSSDVEGILPTVSSEYESALNSQELSVRSQLTSGEYHTAISSLSSKDSMKSFESESSGNLASIEISEASETLVPTNSDLESDIDIIVDQKILDECELLWPVNTDIIEKDLEQENDSGEYFNNESKHSELDTDQSVEIQSKMKRSYEMTFQPEPKIFTEESPHTESNDAEERFGTSLDEGSVLSVSLSSTSSAQLRTVIEFSRNEFGDREESLTSVISDQMSAEEFDSIFKSEDINLQSYSAPSTIQSSHEEIDPVSAIISQFTENSQTDSQKFSHDELKKKGHRRHDSSSFLPSLIHGVTKSRESQSLLEEMGNVEENEQKKHETDILVHGSEELREQNMDLSIKKESIDRKDSHGKSSTTSSEKSSFEDAEAEAAFSMVAHISPVHKMKQICPIIEDIDAEKCELEAKERSERKKECRTTQNVDASPGSIPDIKVTEHMAPLDESNFRYPELEMERKEMEQEVHKTVESETSVSNSSKSSEETDQGRDYILEERNAVSEETDSCEKKKNSESKSEISTVVEKSVTEEERKTDSPNSDSFELIEKPDIIDDFVVIEEVGKEANEMDSEGKSVSIQSKPKRVKKHDEDIDAYLAKSDPTPLTKRTELKYFPENSNDDLDFEFEDSPPQRKFGTEESKDYGLEYDKELEANRKWIEQQFHGDQAAMAAAGYGYEMEFERGPLEDIKEEDINDIDLALSRIGSLGSQKESGGSLASVKDSYSSTPDYDVLAGRKYFTKSGDIDDISMSSLQEFENLERAMSLESKKFHHGSGSQDSSSNGSFKTRYYANKAQGDDISVSSLKEFEGLEKACIAVHKTEVKVKEAEDLLSQIDEVQEILISESEKQEKKPIFENEKEVVESEDGDYEKRILEMNQIIKQAQNNVESFIDLKETDKTESLGRGDSIEEVSKVPDLDLDTPISKSKSKLQWKENDPMITSTDSLNMNKGRPTHYDSTDSLDQKNNDNDIMTASTDSIEINIQLTKGNLASDSMEMKPETSRLVCSDSLEKAIVASVTSQEDSLEEDEPKIYHDYSSSDTGKDFSSSVKEDAGEHDEHLHELMLGSTDSLEPTSSAATHATYQYESDSVFSGSFTSGGSNTMVSSTDTMDPAFFTESIDIAAAATKVWFDKETDIPEKKITFEHFGEPSRPYVTEVIEPSDDPNFSHTIHRLVELPPEKTKVIFRGEDAHENLQRFMNDFEEGEQVRETESVDALGNIHVKKIVQKRFIIKPDDIESSSSNSSRQHVLTKADYDEKKSSGVIFPQLTSLTKSLTGDAPVQPSESTDTAISRAQASRRRPLRYDISIEDQTEVDPREHDWRFDLYKYEQSHDSSTEKPEGQVRLQTHDQHQLSEEMKKLLEEMETMNKE